MKVRALAALVAMASLSVLAGTARAEEPICIPGNGSTAVYVAGKKFTVPGHSLPCTDTL